MNQMSQMLLLVSISCIGLSVFLIFVGRKEGVGFGEVYWRGSFIYRNLGQYVKSHLVKPVIILGYLGAGLFLLFLASLAVS